MTEEEWLASFDPLAMLHWPKLVKRQPRRLRLFGCACCRQLDQWLADPRLFLLREAIKIAEGYADRETSFPHLDRWWSIIANIHGELLEASEPRWKEGIATCQAVLAVLCADSREEWRSAVAEVYSSADTFGEELAANARAVLPQVMRDIFGNPFRPVTFAPEWRTDTAIALARQMYESRDFSAMPILADALQDAGCDSEEVLAHCRNEGVHVRGCWVVDLVLGLS